MNQSLIRTASGWRFHYTPFEKHRSNSSRAWVVRISKDPTGGSGTEEASPLKHPDSLLLFGFHLFGCCWRPEASSLRRAPGSSFIGWLSVAAPSLPNWPLTLAPCSGLAFPHIRVVRRRLWVRVLGKIEHAFYAVGILGHFNHPSLEKGIFHGSNLASQNSL